MLILIKQNCYFSSRPVGKGKAMDLRSKKKDVDTFAAQLESEGESKFILNLLNDGF